MYMDIYVTHCGTLPGLGPTAPTNFRRPARDPGVAMPKQSPILVMLKRPG
jgi:hypothetical protein